MSHSLWVDNKGMSHCLNKINEPSSGLFNCLSMLTDYVCTHTIKQRTHVSPDLHEVCSGRHVSGHISRQHRVKCGPRGVVSGCNIRGTQCMHTKMWVYNTFSLCMKTKRMPLANIFRHLFFQKLKQPLKTSEMYWVSFPSLSLPTAVGTWQWNACQTLWQMETWRLLGAQTNSSLTNCFCPNVHFSFSSMQLSSGCSAGPIINTAIIFKTSSEYWLISVTYGAHGWEVATHN